MLADVPIVCTAQTGWFYAPRFLNIDTQLAEGWTRMSSKRMCAYAPPYPLATLVCAGCPVVRAGADGSWLLVYMLTGHFCSIRMSQVVVSLWAFDA